MAGIKTARPFFRPRDEGGRFLPEGPRTIVLEGRTWLAWIDIQTGIDATTGRMNLVGLDGTEHRVIPLPGRPGFFVEVEPGRLLMGIDKTIGHFDLMKQGWTPLARIPDDHPRTIINDGEAIDGCFIFGTKDRAFRDPIAHLYAFNPATRQLVVLADGQTCSNGKVSLSPGVFLDIDTPTRCVRRYTWDPQSMSILSAEVALDLQSHEGFPDGMVASRPGRVIIAFYDPRPAACGFAREFDLTTGEVTCVWETPGAPRVTCPWVEGEADGSATVYLTTCTEGMPEAGEPRFANAGTVFRAPWEIG
jgi:sugar lactone lactonase YvrE